MRLENLKPINIVLMMARPCLPLLWVSSLPNLCIVRESLQHKSKVFTYLDTPHSAGVLSPVLEAMMFLQVLCCASLIRACKRRMNYLNLPVWKRVAWGPLNCTPRDCTDAPKVSLEDLFSPPQHLVPRAGQSAREGPWRAAGEDSSALRLPSLRSSCSSGKEGKPKEIHNGTFFSIVFPLLGLHLPWPSATQPSGVGENCTAPFVGLCALMPSILFATAQFSVPYLRDGAIPSNYNPTSLCYLQGNQA